MKGMLADYVNSLIASVAAAVVLTLEIRAALEEKPIGPIDVIVGLVFLALSGMTIFRTVTKIRRNR